MMWTTSRTILPGLLLVTIITDVQSDSQVSQDPDLHITEDQDISLKCTHTISNYDLLVWYKQFPGLGLEICSYGVSSPTNLYSRYSMTMERSTLSTQLHIKNVKGEDTAVYYCAVSGSGWGKLIFGSGTQLQVNPQTDRTSPSVYQLTSYKPTESLPNTVCLVTDFPSPNKTLDVDKQEIELNDIAVLDKSSSDVWRYSAVIWDQDNPSKDLSCAVKYDGETVHPDTIIDETTDTCSSLSVTKRFHTNPSMNTLSTSVLGLRILTAKAVVFNLMINLRLWSS
ncbi:T cell receptor alpha chain MC.7.G5-like isoform X1 [Bufo bufo]|uniref:T cell receptor alpha chain MC.7.G5-like isoform X1 n=1 Tax=Bufo bufo TaxID=8384 RepID=UPI001ABDDCD9|nr:T cell receptor alpha chain MC.7.G5-like isoform X1 [Bufo bufo]